MMGLSVTAFAQGTEELPAEDATNDSNVVVEETEDLSLIHISKAEKPGYPRDSPRQADSEAADRPEPGRFQH